MPEEAINIEDIIFSDNENSNDETISVDDIIFEPGKTTDPASSSMDSGSENGFSEQSEISQILEGLPNIASNTSQSLINFATKDLPALAFLSL